MEAFRALNVQKSKQAIKSEQERQTEFTFLLFVQRSLEFEINVPPCVEKVTHLNVADLKPPLCVMLELGEPHFKSETLKNMPL
ncbi:UNVERIFIED_CONTAM: hypothetical protein FKN15_002386 [Acipenser sinensis]